MSNTNKCGRVYGVSICWMLVWLLPLSLLRAEKGHTAAGETKHGAGFILTRQGDRFSLSAQQASLRELVETLGNMLAIDVVARIPRDQKFTLNFAGLSLEDAIQRLRIYANIVYIKDTKQPSGKITKIMMIPMQGGERVTRPTVRKGAQRTPLTSAQPEPFKFEFDPSKHMEKKQ